MSATIALGLASLAVAAAIGLGMTSRTRRQVRAGEVLASMGRYDTLTGLPNRSGLDEHFARWSEKKSERASLALTIFDVEGLERCSALLGHGSADDVLIECARLLLDAVETEGFVGRLDGDKFVAVIEFVSDEQLIRTLQALRLKLDQLIETSGLLGKALITAGVAVAPDDGVECEQLLQGAVAALHWAREDAVERLAFFEPAMNERLAARAALERDLAHAVTNDQIEPYFQPVVSLSDGQVQSYEILARWHDDTRGLVKPEVFIPLAEQCALIDTLTFNILKRACIQTTRWPPHTRLSLNVPPSLLSRPGTAFCVLTTLSSVGFPASRLEIEITETGPIENISQARENLTVLRSRGVRVALDDFGVGYSSLSRLQELPVDIIKIDRCFIETLLTHDETREIVGCIIRLGHKLGVAVAAEGIESLEQADALKALGCDLGQGYLFGPPQNAKAILAAAPLLAQSIQPYANFAVGTEAAAGSVIRNVAPSPGRL